MIQLLDAQGREQDNSHLLDAGVRGECSFCGSHQHDSLAHVEDSLAAPQDDIALHIAKTQGYPMGYRICPHCLNTAVIEDGYCGHCRECTMPPSVQDPAPHIAKIPLRAELRDLLIAADLYAEQAAKHQGEADRLRELSIAAKQQAENLRVKANL